jgi:hypothetical protein
MRILGFLVLLLGVASILLPKFTSALDKVFAPIAQWQPWSGIAIAVLGLVLLLAGGKKRASH